MSSNVAVVVLRTLVGWHFFYEGFYKLMLPGWTRLGQPASAWSAAGYLTASVGPFAALFRALAHSSALGVIDVVVPLGLILVGFLRREGRVPSAAAIESTRMSVGMDKVTFDPVARAIRFETPSVELNLGAIGKGYALDRMGEVLREHGVTRALISAGGSSVLALGGSRRGWSIDLTSARTPRSRLARVHLRDGALGTSGAGEQFVVSDGTRYGHVIDPRTGWPAQGVLSASVIAKDAAAADALSTAFLVGGPELAARYCDQHAETMAVLTLEGNEPHAESGPVPRVFGRSTGATLER